MYSYGEAQDHLSGLLHGADIDDIEGLPMVFERAANTMLSKLDPIDTVRVAPLTQTIHDDVFNYSLPSDFKSPIDLYPEDSRNSSDVAVRRPAQGFDLKKGIESRQISIEASEGTKFLRVNWKSRAGQTLNQMDSLTSNGAWSVVGSATGLKANSIFKVSGSASIEFDLVSTGDGIQNTTMTAVDLTDEDEVADIFLWAYFGATTNLTSVSVKWGNDLTTNYWTSTAATTQADGTAFKVGWNLLKFSWSTATETGTVVPSTIDSFKLTIAATTAISNIRIDNIIFSIGRPFDLKYYSKYVFKNAAGVWLTRPSDDEDVLVLDNDAAEIFFQELLIEAAHSIESSNSAGDISFAETKLNGNPRSPDPSMKLGLYAKYKKRYPSMSTRQVGSYGSAPARGRWGRGRV